MGATGKLIAVCLSEKQGTRKAAVPVGVLRKAHGLVGDAHAGSQREVSLLAVESIEKMRAQGLSLSPGDFAENLTTSGLLLHTLPLGTRLRVGTEALLEITQIGKTCHSACEIRRLTGDCIMPTEGVFARVLAGGEIKAQDDIAILDSQGESCDSHG
jgi:MOSC domain-containing protein YiiM